MAYKAKRSRVDENKVSLDESSTLYLELQDLEQKISSFSAYLIELQAQLQKSYTRKIEVQQRLREIAKKQRIMCTSSLWPNLEVKVTLFNYSILEQLYYAGMTVTEIESESTSVKKFQLTLLGHQVTYSLNLLSKVLEDVETPEADLMSSINQFLL